MTEDKLTENVCHMNKKETLAVYIGWYTNKGGPSGTVDLLPSNTGSLCLGIRLNVILCLRSVCQVQTCVSTEVDCYGGLRLTKVGVMCLQRHRVSVAVSVIDPTN